MGKTTTEKQVQDELDNKPDLCEDVVNHPSHYTFGKYECIEVLQDILTAEQFEGFCLGNTVKYIWRAGKKDPTKKLEDLEKSKFYLDRLVEFLNPDEQDGKEEE